MKTLLSLIICIMLLTPAHAGNEEIENEITDNISHEFVVCGSYFFVVSEGLQKTGKKEEAEKYLKAYKMAIFYALRAAEETRSEEMAQKVTTARFAMSIKDMLNEIENDYSNISVLLIKYSDYCKAAIEDPETFMKEWTTKILERTQREK